MNSANEQDELMQKIIALKKTFKTLYKINEEIINDGRDGLSYFNGQNSIIKLCLESFSDVE